jgi:hypothetical protein
MLLDAPYKKSDIISLKLSSGEEIVARLEEEGTEYYSLKKPMVLIAGEKGLGLAPFMFSVSPDGKFSITKTSTSCIAKTEVEIAKQYTAQTTGLAIV